LHNWLHGTIRDDLIKPGMYGWTGRCLDTWHFATAVAVFLPDVRMYRSVDRSTAAVQNHVCPGLSRGQACDDQIICPGQVAGNRGQAFDLAVVAATVVVVAVVYAEAIAGGPASRTGAGDPFAQ